MTAEAEGIVLDYSRQNATPDTMRLLLDLAQAAKVPEKMVRARGGAPTCGRRRSPAGVCDFDQAFTVRVFARAWSVHCLCARRVRSRFEARANLETRGIESCFVQAATDAHADTAPPCRPSCVTAST